MDSSSARRSPPVSAPVGASFSPDVLPWEDLPDDDAASQVVGSDYDVDEDERFWTAPAAHAGQDVREDTAETKDEVDEQEEVQEKAPKTPRKPPLRLLDLPVDVLDIIMREITHTNDMCSLTLTCSTLHRLAIPVIYSRFDIVWPDNSVELQPRTGVDALTFGLATLVMGNELFSEQSATAAGRRPECENCAQAREASEAQPPRFRRRGNDYARHVRKFSLGNGPAEWVRDYTVGKEAGKMLGTLVALAVGRMRNLETFSWDMPTGVIRDVWMSLSSLGDRLDTTPCRLERVHIRWHNNWESPDAPTSPILQVQNPGGHGANATSTQNAINAAAAAAASNTHANAHAGANDESDDDDTESFAEAVEQPTFSLLPPLKALSVLDIDELSYLDEMKALIGRSRIGLRELRVGIADHVKKKDWVSSWEGQGAQPVSAEATHTQTDAQSQRRVGGVLGILFGQLEDSKAVMQDSTNAPSLEPNKSHDPAVEAASTQQAKENVPVQLDTSHESRSQHQPNNSEPATSGASEGDDAAGEPTAASIKGVFKELFHSLETQKQREPEVPESVQAKLALEVLELERVPISPRIMIKYMDWTRLNGLTLLGCQNADALWKALAGDKALANKRSSLLPSQKPKNSIVDQGLGLRKLYVDSVTPVLLSFVKDALKPNTLEMLILQSRTRILGRVTADDIYKGPIRRHRASLQKVSIDASEKTPEGEIAHDSTAWERWIVPKGMLAFALSGKMPQLRELCVSINHKDWHFLLQQLPQAPRLRSLYIPFLKRLPRVPESSIDAREHALQIVDVAALRPEVRLTYIGIAWKCFEILEVSAADDELDAPPAVPAQNPVDVNDDEDEDGDEEDDEEDDENIGGAVNEDEDDPLASVHAASMNALHGDDASDVSEDGDQSSKTRLKLREILFYDDKVAVFRARHGRL